MHAVEHSRVVCAGEGSRRSTEDEKKEKVEGGKGEWPGSYSFFFFVEIILLAACFRSEVITGKMFIQLWLLVWSLYSTYLFFFFFSQVESKFTISTIF